MRCDVCGLPDRYNGNGDGIGSCDCPRCDCGSAHWSVFCTCDPDDDYPAEPVELPGMWEVADFTGGRDETRGPRHERRASHTDTEET